MTEKVVVTVTIGGEEYTLKSDRSQEYARAAAERVDQALREAQRSGSVVETHKTAVLAALAITDELFQAKQAQEEMASRLSAMAVELERLLPPAKRVSQGFASPTEEA
ncbi:MAG TPA: cell division protein ZapA [Gemmatimonadales bacterium]|jgi:cell division protein ZapA